LKRAGDDVELGVRRAANRVDRAVDNLDNDLALDGNGAANTTRRRTPSVKQLGKDVGRDVEDTARTIGRNVEDSARKFGRAVEDTFD
ncbi:MAG TPA: hypothetical protein VEI97_12020, partial [bacterium]|nr:hypothetical protein [bacterium]